MHVYPLAIWNSAIYHIPYKKNSQILQFAVYAKSNKIILFNDLLTI